MVLEFFLYAILSIYSMNLLLKISPITIQIIQILGAFFLIFIGWKILFFKPSNEENNEAYKIPKSLFDSYLIGFTASLINPKVMIFFSAIFSQFLNDDYSTQTKFGMALLAGIIDAFWYLCCRTFSIIQNYIKTKQKTGLKITLYFNVCVIFSNIQIINRFTLIFFIDLIFI